MDLNRPWLSGSLGYPGRLPATGQLPVALPGLTIRNRDPRFIIHTISEESEGELDGTSEHRLPTYDEASLSLGIASETTSRAFATDLLEDVSAHSSGTGSWDQAENGVFRNFHSTTLPTVERIGRRLSLQPTNESFNDGDAEVYGITGSAPENLHSPGLPDLSMTSRPNVSKAKRKRGFFGQSSQRRRSNAPESSRPFLVTQAVDPTQATEGVILSPHSLGSARNSAVHTNSSGGSTKSGSGITGTGSGSSYTGSTSTSTSSSSSSSSDSDDDRPFLDYLDEEMQDALRDGEDFDYIGLVAHPTVGQDETRLKENLEAMKEIVRKVKEQPWHMRRKLKLYRLCRVYIERYEGRLSKGRGARLAGLAKFFKTARRYLANWFAVMMPWEDRIKSIENRFGSAAASYFILLRWIIGVNVVQTLFIVGFVMVPQAIFGDKHNTTFRTTMTTTEARKALDFKTIYHYAGYMLYTVIYYGYYGDEKIYSFGYRLPLAYFSTTVAIFVHSFWVVLAKMAANVREGTGSGGSDQYMFSTRTFCSWDYMIANRDTGDNKVAAVSRAFRELILDEHHKGKKENKWLRLFLRFIAWIITGLLLALSVYILIQVMKWKKNFADPDPSFFQSNAVSFSLKGISLVFPELFERLEILEEYHPLIALRMHLTRITMLNLLTNYALINNWITEAQDAFRESVHAKSTFPWIWNTSYSSHPMPADWQTQQFNPNLHEAGGEEHESHGAPEISGHGSSISASHDIVVLPSQKSSESHAEVHGVELSPTNESGHNPAATDGHLPKNDITVTASHTRLQPVLRKPDFSLAVGDPYTVTTRQVVVQPVLRRPDFSLAVGDPVDQVIKASRTYHDTTEAGVSGAHELLLYSSSVSADGSAQNLSSGLGDLVSFVNSFDLSNTPQAFSTTEPPDLVTLDHPTGAARFITRSVRTRRPTTPTPPPTTTEAIITVQKVKDLCWENKVAFEGLENLVTESIASVLEVVITELLRDVFVRFMARCWFWDLETVPGYAHFRISENVLGLIVGQQMTWIAFFFAPCLIPINLLRLLFLMYFRSWVTHVCCVPPETMFNTGKGNNFYFFILLLLLFVSTLFFGYTVIFLNPSWQCGPFSQYKMIYDVVLDSLPPLPPLGRQIADYIASPALIIPFFMMLAIIIFYLLVARSALAKHTKDLRRTLEIERTEERRKMLAQLEEKKKRAQQKLLGAANATGEDLEVTIEQANENTKSLLDKMQNRGFPPEEHAGPALVHQRRKSLLFKPRKASFKQVAQSVVFVHRLSKPEISRDNEPSVTGPPHVVPPPPPLPPTVHLAPTTLRFSDKFKGTSVAMPAVEETEEMTRDEMTETVIDIEDGDSNSSGLPFRTRQPTGSPRPPAQPADSESIRNA